MRIESGSKNKWKHYGVLSGFTEEESTHLAFILLLGQSLVCLIRWYGGMLQSLRNLLKHPEGIAHINGIATQIQAWVQSGHKATI